MSDLSARVKLPTKEVTMKSVMELSDELKSLMIERDNRLYPSLDNVSCAYVRLYAMFAVWADYGLTTDEIKKRLVSEIDSLKNEMAVL